MLKFKNDFVSYHEDKKLTITNKQIASFYKDKGFSEKKINEILGLINLENNVEFEFSEDHIVSTHSNSNGYIFRYIYKGSFDYSQDGTLKRIEISDGIRVFHHQKSNLEYGERAKFSKPILLESSESLLEWENTVENLFQSQNILDDYEVENGIYEIYKGEGSKQILQGEFANLYRDGWQTDPFGSNLITQNGNITPAPESGTPEEKVESEDDYSEQSAAIKMLTGTSKNDKLRGKKTAVHIKGMAGNDKLTGSRKDDILDGGDGNDVLTGKKGADTYVLSSGKDKFKGFKLKEGDTIEIDSDISYTLVQSKKNTLIHHDDGVTTVLKVNKDDLAGVIELV